MAFTVFLSHSLDPAEQALAWRLQTLAGAHGIQMLVPVRESMRPVQGFTATTSIRSAIDRADCVLAIITASADSNVLAELNYALAKKKLTIPIVRAEVANGEALATFPHIFRFSPSDNPGTIEAEIVTFLKQQKIGKDQQQALGALAAVGIGLLFLFALTEK